MGQRAPNAVDIDTSTRVDNISDNICVVLQCMMDTFHQFDLDTVFLNYIRYCESVFICDGSEGKGYGRI